MPDFDKKNVGIPKDEVKCFGKERIGVVVGRERRQIQAPALFAVGALGSRLSTLSI